MPHYYVNKNPQPTGEHEVHRAGCDWMPKPENRIFLGDYATCGPAKKAALVYYDNVDGCAHCSPACHSR